MPAAREEPVTVSQVDLVHEIRAALADAADPARAPQMRAYMKSTMPFRGVAAPPLKQLCRAVFGRRRLADRQTWETTVLTLWDTAEFREERYAALALATHRYYREFQDVSTLALYRHLVETGAWWDYVDAIASRSVGPILRGDHDRVAPIMRAWAVDDHLWVRRTAILCQLASKAQTDPHLLSDTIGANLMGSRYGAEFFVRKAVGWALREYAKHDPDWVSAFVADHHDQLSALSRREALKNLRA